MQVEVVEVVVAAAVELLLVEHMLVDLVQVKEVEVVGDTVLVGRQAVEVVQHREELVERQVVDTEVVKVPVVVQAELMELQEDMVVVAAVVVEQLVVEHMVQVKEQEVVADMVLVEHKAVEVATEVVVEVVQHQEELVEHQAVDTEVVKVLVVVQEDTVAVVEVEPVVEEPMPAVKGVDMQVDMVVVKGVDQDMVVVAMPLENFFSSQFANTI